MSTPLRSKVFISCGQATGKEKKVSTKIKDWLEDRGYRTYVAIQTHSIQDLNTSIIGNLTSADYYIFIDFRREKISHHPKEYRGSLFTNQELAIAHYLGFERVLFFRQSKVRLEGIGKYILSNAIEFNDLDEAMSLVWQEFEKREQSDNWNSHYSRHLVPSAIEPVGRLLTYKDHTGSYEQYIWHAYIDNRTTERVAFSTAASLKHIKYQSKLYPSQDDSYLKWAGHHECYQRTIPPGETAAFDAFAINAKPPYDVVYLHSTEDFLPRNSLGLDAPGRYTLYYQVLALNFPVLEFRVRLNLTGKISTTSAKILDSA